jgi:hypothetical protein
VDCHCLYQSAESYGGNWKRLGQATFHRIAAQLMYTPDGPMSGRVSSRAETLRLRTLKAHHHMDRYSTLRGAELKTLTARLNTAVTSHGQIYAWDLLRQGGRTQDYAKVAVQAALDAEMALDAAVKRADAATMLVYTMARTLEGACKEAAQQAVAEAKAKEAQQAVAAVVVVEHAVAAERRRGGEEIQFDSLSDEELIRRLDELLIDRSISLKWESVD